MPITDQARILRETMCQVLERTADPLSYHHTFRSVIAYAESCLPWSKADFSDTKLLGEQIEKKICDAKATGDDIDMVKIIHTNNNKLLRDALIHLIDDHHLSVYEAVAEVRNVLANRNQQYTNIYNDPLKAAAINCMDTAHVFEKVQLDAAHAMITALGKKAADAFNIVTGTHGDDLALLPSKILWAKKQVEDLAAQLARKGKADLQEIKSIALEISHSTKEVVNIEGVDYPTYFFDKAIIGSLFTVGFNQTLFALITNPASSTAANVSMALSNSTNLLPQVLNTTVLNQTIANVTQTLSAAITPASPETFFMMAANHVYDNPEMYAAISVVTVLALCFRNKLQHLNPFRFAGNRCNLFSKTDSKKYDDAPIHDDGEKKAFLAHN